MFCLVLFGPLLLVESKGVVFGGVAWLIGHDSSGATVAGWIWQMVANLMVGRAHHDLQGATVRSLGWAVRP